MKENPKRLQHNFILRIFRKIKENREGRFNMIDLSILSKADFDPHINTQFSFCQENNNVNLELIETRDCSSKNVNGFSLLFKGPLDKEYPQKIYPLEHPKIGKLEIFIVPVNKDAEGIYYEAIFTRLKK